MSDKEMQKELEQLRSEVAALSQSRAGERTAKQEADIPAKPIEEPGQLAASTVVEAASIDIDDPDAVQNQMDHLLEQLEQEIRDLPTITTLAVFSLGVLFGRLLR